MVVSADTFFCMEAPAHRDQHHILYHMSCHSCCLGAAIQRRALHQQPCQGQEAGVGVPLNQIRCRDKGL